MVPAVWRTLVTQRPVGQVQKALTIASVAGACESGVIPIVIGLQATDEILNDGKVLGLIFFGTGEDSVIHEIEHDRAHIRPARDSPVEEHMGGHRSKFTPRIPVQPVEQLEPADMAGGIE